MEKFVYRSEALARERRSYWEAISLLESTEGFSILTAKQRQVIRVSLCLQDRSDRDDESTFTTKNWFLDFFRRRESQVQKYTDSTEHIINWYCHAAIASLESGCLGGDEPPDHPLEFFDATYFEAHTEYELRQAVKFIGFPSVVHVNLDSDNVRGEDSQYHSFLVLGHDKNKNIIIWDKEGYGYPYRVTTLAQVYSEYDDFEYWGVRKLRVSPVTN
jgi:hypothetical protein